MNPSPSATSGASSIGAFLAPLSLLRAFTKRWIVALITIVAVALPAGFYVYRMPNVYKADTTILVEQQKIPERLVVSTVQVELQDRLATITQQIMSATQLQKIIQARNLYVDMRNTATQEEVIEKMRADIDVKVEKGWSRSRPGAFKISYKAPDPQTAMIIANELAGLFVDENIKAREVQASGTTEFLTTQLEEARKRLLEQEAKVAAYKQKNAGQLPSQGATLMMAITNLQNQLKSVDEGLNHSISTKEMIEAELRSAEAGYDRMVAIANTPAPPPVQTSSPAASPADPMTSTPASSSPTLKRSEQLEALLDQLLQRYTDKHPQVRAVRTELERQKGIEAREAKEVANAAAAAKAAAAKSATASGSAAKSVPAASGVSAQTAVLLEQQKERVDRVKAELTRATNDVKTRQAEMARLEQQLSAEQAKLERLPVNEQEFISVTRDYDISRRAYEDLLSKSYTANTAEDMEKKQKAERFAVLDIARLPEKPSSPRREIIYPAICAVAALLGILVAVFIESRRNVVLGEWELPKDVWVLGRIPAMSDLKPIRGALPAGSGD